MRVGILTFRGVVSPRADIAEAINIYDEENGEFVFKERIELFLSHPFELMDILKSKSINYLISSAIPRNLIFLLESSGIRVFYVPVGGIEEALKLFKENKSNFGAPGFYTSFGWGRRRRKRFGWKKWQK